MTERTIIPKNQIISKLTAIAHGNLNVYSEIGLQAAMHEPLLLAHLICWNNKNGQVRDSKTALPIVALRGDKDDELFENAVANICTLDPRRITKAVDYSRALTSAGYPLTDGAGKLLKYGVRRYLEVRQENDQVISRAILQHKRSLKELYAKFHIKPTDFVQKVLFERKRPKGSIFYDLAKLHLMSPTEAAGTIINRKIPFLIASGAVGGFKDKPDIVMALIENMSRQELVNNSNMLSKIGVFQNPVLSAAYDSAIDRTKKDKRASTLKAGVAASKVKDKKARAKLTAMEEDSLDALPGVEGDWLILADKSPSMEMAIKAAINITALVSKQVRGKTYLVFFDEKPMPIMDLTNASYEEIKKKVSRIRAGGNGTSIGCGLGLVNAKGIEVNGIIIISDGEENRHPRFVDEHRKYSDKFGVSPTVYHAFVDNHGYWGRNTLESDDNVKIERIDVDTTSDYYSAPNLIRMLRPNLYSLYDEVMSAELLTFNDVFKLKKEAA
jgi:hypothetical protein